MPQYFIDTSFDVGSEVEIRGADAKHIAQVLRLAAGDWLILSDGKGRSYRAEILSSSMRAIRARVTGLRSMRSRSTLALAVAIIKHDRTEAIIQKAVELGTAEIIPFHSRRTVPRLVADVTERRLVRWQRIAVEAAKQSGLPFKPVVESPLSFLDVCARMKDYASTLLFWEGEQEHDIASRREFIRAGAPSLVVVGPEGGFAEEEVEAARGAGAVTASLGQQILRVETAAIAALSICVYESGGFALNDDAHHRT